MENEILIIFNFEKLSLFLSLNMFQSWMHLSTFLHCVEKKTQPKFCKINNLTKLTTFQYIYPLNSTIWFEFKNQQRNELKMDLQYNYILIYAYYQNIITNRTSPKTKDVVF